MKNLYRLCIRLPQAPEDLLYSGFTDDALDLKPLANQLLGIGASVDLMVMDLQGQLAHQIPWQNVQLTDVYSYVEG